VSGGGAGAAGDVSLPSRPPAAVRHSAARGRDSRQG